MSPSQLLERALSRHSAGDFPAALSDYRALLVLLPQDPAAAGNGAMAWLALGQARQAAGWSRMALRLAPDVAALHRLDAEITQSPQGFRLAWVLQPDSAETNNNFANFLSAGGEEAAIAFYRRSLYLQPGRGEAFGNLAACLLAQHREAEAALAGRTALALAPDNAYSCNNLGNALFEQRAYGPALAAFRRARRLRPTFTDACINESGLRLDLGEAEAGAALCRLALALAPDRPGCYNNLGNGELLACRLGAAESAFRHALQLAPHDAQTHFNFAAVLLKQGRMQEGWTEYEWRRRTPAAIRRRRTDDPPDWPGGDPKQRAILLSAEQGFGDALQFCRFAPWLAAKGAKVVLRTHAPLVRLMRSLEGVTEVIGPDDDGIAAEFHLPLMSVPQRFGMSLEEIPAATPYLAAGAKAVAAWRRRLKKLPGRKVGLAWSGDPRPGQRSAHLLDRRRSLTLRHFDGLADIEGITMISLQKGEPGRQTGALSLIDWSEELSDFADTAALIASLDLVIAVDTAVAHLAGALGRPVWILSRFDGCWRWLDGRQDSPWYPTARLFRQPSPGDWVTPLAEIKRALLA